MRYVALKYVCFIFSKTTHDYNQAHMKAEKIRYKMGIAD